MQAAQAKNCTFSTLSFPVDTPKANLRYTLSTSGEQGAGPHHGRRVS